MKTGIDAYENLDLHTVELEDGKVARLYLPKILLVSDVERMIKMLDSLVIDD